MITVQVRAQRAAGALRRLARELGDRRAANQALSDKMFQMVADNFDTESHDGEPWVDLAPSTRRWKERRGYDKILQNTGALRQSFLPFSDNDQAGVGALSALEHAELSEKHERGIGVPARPMLPSRARALEEAVEVYGFFLGRARGRADL